MKKGIRFTNLYTLQPQAATSVMQAGINLGYTEAELCNMYSNFVQAGYSSSSPAMNTSYNKAFTFTGTFTKNPSPGTLSPTNIMNTATTTINLTNTSQCTWTITGGSVVSLTTNASGTQAILTLNVGGGVDLTLMATSPVCSAIKRRQVIRFVRPSAIQVNASPSLFSNYIQVEIKKDFESELNFSLDSRNNSKFRNLDYNVELLSYEGKTIEKKMTTLDNKVNFDTGNISSGIYFVRIRNKNETIIKKVIKH